MVSANFLEKLLVRLKSGDTRSIHLNALPGNFARLDIYDLINIEQGLHLKFLDLLLTKPTFKFSITIEPGLIQQKNNDDKKLLHKIIKRLNHLDYQEKEELSEHGYTSFGFGYPLLIKRDKIHTDRILKAPLLIWYLKIEKDTKKNNTWIISRLEDQPLVFNEILQSHFESSERIKTNDLEELIEDDFLDEKKLNLFCKKLLEKLNVSFDANENIATLLPGTNKASIELLTKEQASIRWSGIFGLFKMQKQSIIKDLENLIEEKNFTQIPEETNFDGEVLTPVLLDPSQENVLQQLNQYNNIIIQGPPGTGKSQSLTAIITQALLNKKKVLVVCEKRTAMEVLFNNLKKLDLQHLCALIEDVYSDRKTIVEHVRNLIEQEAIKPERFRNNEYEVIRSQFLSLQEEINHRLNFNINEIFGDDNWMELLEKSARLNEDKLVLEKANTIHKIIRNSDYQFTFEEYIFIIDRIKESQLLFSKIDDAAFVFDALLNDKLKECNNTEGIISDLILLKQEAEELESIINSGIAKHKNLFNKIYTWQDKISKLFKFPAKYYSIFIEKVNAIKVFYELQQKCNRQNYFQINNYTVQAKDNLDNLLPYILNIKNTTQKFIVQKDNFDNYFHYKKYYLNQEQKIQTIMDALIKTGHSDWDTIFTTFYLNQTILKISIENGITDDTQKIYTDLYKTDILLKDNLSLKIKNSWQEIIQNKIALQDLSHLKYLYNQRKNKQFSSKNSLRKIIHQDIDFFSTVFPVIMVNPSVASSILPLKENLFDFIIMDEASQLRLEDTYTSLLRGTIKIISGDKHQMPPSNFFGNEVIFWNEIEDENTVEDFLAESKSLLEFANDFNFKNTSLDFHYRSLHPDLIQFSNYAFYQSRLIPMPEKIEYQPISYKNVAGIYNNGTNIKEAEAIVDFIFQTKKVNNEYPSIGIATFNLFQRNLIFDEIYEQAYSDVAKNEILQALLQKGLFVKNLENIQGDERDIMILSTTFGKDNDGKFRQSFGPLSQQKGYQLLNVIITRAKYALHVFSSIPEQVFLQFESELAEKGNSGKSILYAYLSYVKACSENNKEQINFIKNALQKNSLISSESSNKTESSIFKNHVTNVLKNAIDFTIVQNYRLGGFVLDIVIFKNDVPVLLIDFENTQNYHPDVNYRIKLHQQTTLLEYNIKTYQLWSYNWWNDCEKEIQSIRNLLNS